MPIQRALLYIVVLCILLGGGMMAGQWDKDTGNLSFHADEIAAFTADQEKEALAWARASAGTLAQNQAVQPDKPYTVLLHRSDSLLGWSNNHIIPGKKTLMQLKGDPRRQLLELPQGVFLATTEPAGTEFLTILIPLRYDDALSEGHPFPAAPALGEGISLYAQGEEAPVVLDGKPVAWLYGNARVGSAWYQQLQLLFLCLAMLVFWLLIHRAARWLAGRAGEWAAALWVLLASAGLAFGFAAWSMDAFTELPLFANGFTQPSPLGFSLGTWLLSLLLLAGVVGYWHRYWPLPTPASGAGRMATGILGYCAMMLCAPLTALLIRHLILFSGIPFDFDNIFQLNGYSLGALSGLLICLISAFLWSQRWAQMIQSAELPRATRLGWMAAAALVTGIAVFILPLDTLTARMLALGFALVFALGMDAFAHWEAPGFGWVVVWLLVYSLFSSTFLYHFQENTRETERREYAQALSTDRDTVMAEHLLPQVYRQIQADSLTLQVLLKPWPFKAGADELRDYINRFLYQYNYLFQHYTVHVNAFDREHQLLLLHQTADYATAVETNWQKGTELAPGIRYGTDAQGKFRYMLYLRALRMNDATQPADVYVFLEHEFPKSTRVYAQMFYNTPYKRLQHLAQYDFAVKNGDHLVVEQGKTKPDFQASSHLGSGAFKEIKTDQRREVLAKSADGRTLALVGNAHSGPFKQVYLFSMLFTAASFILLLLALLNNYLPILPDAFRLHLRAQGTLARRIHFWTVILIGAAFLVIGWMTYRHFTEAFEAAERNDLDYRANALHTSLENQALGSTLASDSLAKNLTLSLRNMAAAMSVDAQLYDPKGVLSFTTQPDLAGLQVLPGRINPLVMGKNGALSDADQTFPERIGATSYRSKYLPLYNARQQVLGYLGVPYQLSSRKIGAEVSDFIGILASLYVFLLLLAYVITFFLARSITKPVALISEKIRQIKLEDKNEQLEYKGDAEDELSELIEQYNRMVVKLEESKVQMIRLEREGAWREMARQVAHDIKNPLTTMKLSMQQLERVSSDPEQAAAYLRKAITRLIEQIDSLAQIASEFSMFANLDIRKKDDMVLNEIVENVHDLFSEQKNVDLNLTLPKERFHVLGDKNHLIRVFNNLVINAIQAIPSDRRGLIQVSMYRMEHTAVVQISDNGGGIPVEIRQRVFEPNFTTKTSGSGLGLAICKKIIEGHDGNIRFETRDNEGTDFFVEVPIARAD
jgi:two-component system, NtrC family, nitrogen regulation sensor histidine kinase NtrY